MRLIPFVIPFVLAAVFLSGSAADAQDRSLSDLIATRGLAAAEAAVAEPADASERFALGGIRFLRAIEATLQTRWRLGLNADRSEVPVLRLPIPPNPAPDSFRPEDFEAMFAGLVADMAAARAPLAEIGDADAVGLSVSLDDLWFDIDADGARDPGEGLTEVAGLALTGRPLQGPSPTIRFDTADAAWLAAYTHFLAAIGELVLAFEPTSQIARVAEASAAMDALAANTPYPNGFDTMFGQQIDRIATLYFSLRQQPDPAHTRAARRHMLTMIAENRVFWARVAAETDNTGEWVPNDAQDQALGLPVPQGTGARWQAVLADAEALLLGEKLIPHWRFRTGAGINLMRLMENPVPVDLAEWVHGIGLLPFVEEGTRIDPRNLRDFDRLMRGDSFLYVLFLN